MALSTSMAGIVGLDSDQCHVVPHLYARTREA
jgi:hypothetical protein